MIVYMATWHKVILRLWKIAKLTAITAQGRPEFGATGGGHNFDRAMPSLRYAHHPHSPILIDAGIPR